MTRGLIREMQREIWDRREFTPSKWCEDGGLHSDVAQAKKGQSMTQPPDVGRRDEYSPQKASRTMTEHISVV